MALSDNHTRHLLATLAEMDGLLADIESLVAWDGAASPLSRLVRDVMAIQARVTSSVVAQLRDQMGSLLKALEVAPPTPRTGCVWAIRIRLMKVETLLVDLQPAQLRGYGDLPADAASALRAQVAGLERTLRRLSDFLAEGTGEGLGQRLARLERAGGDAGLLRAIERIVARHGLIEFRDAITGLVERLESPPRFEIAVFGRVSSGKSTLLNRLLGHDVLPVGVTPVTGLPTRITHGDGAAVEVAFADRPAASVGVEDLDQFVSEQGNPGNAKLVAEVVVRLPAARLDEGIVLVDTPGVGSLASSGARQALAYLPRCDLGLLLIDASSTLTPDDLQLLHGLHLAAVPAMVVVSKCDLLTPPELERAVRYIGDTLAAQLGASVPVHAVSALASCARTVDDWFEGQIRPLCRDYRTLSRASAQRKVGQLRLGVAAALRRSLARPTPGAGPIPAAVAARVETRLAEADRHLEAARQGCQAQVDALRASQPRLVEAALQTLGALPSGLSAAEAADGLNRAITAQVLARGQAIHAQVRSARVLLQQTVADLRLEVAVPSGPADLEADVPLAALPTPQGLAPTGLATRLGSPRTGVLSGPVWRHRARRRVAAVLDGALRAGLARHASVLQDWAQDRLDSLAEAYEAAVAGYRTALRQALPAGAGPDPADGDAFRDLRALEAIPAAAAPAEEEPPTCPS